MSNLRKHRLIDIDWPLFGGPGTGNLTESTAGKVPSFAAPEELSDRLQAVRLIMDRQKLTHLAVYGDREHFANITYLTGFDPRYEEALLIVSQNGPPLILVGNECEAYLAVSPLFCNGNLRSERFQPFSLLDQPRESMRPLKEILAGEGIDARATVGCIGWKYYTSREHPDCEHAIELPAVIVDTLRELAGFDSVVNASGIMMDARDGLRATCSASEIAYFEYTNILASEGMKSMLLGLREGMVDYEAAALYGYNGVPLSCHMTLVTGQNREQGLSGPIGALIRRGDPMATNIAYWGSNSCRAGWIAETARDLPTAASDYITGFAGPYFEVLGEWYSRLMVGASCGALCRFVQENLPYEQFGIYLNPGHLIHLDEWLSSPFYPESQIPLQSGMVIQVDVIPSSEAYFSTRMEDGLVIADRALREELGKSYPGVFSRCRSRRAFLSDTLGIEVPEDVLPLSNIQAIVPPFFLEPRSVLALEP